MWLNLDHAIAKTTYNQILYRGNFYRNLPTYVSIKYLL